LSFYWTLENKRWQSQRDRPRPQRCADLQWAGQCVERPKANRRGDPDHRQAIALNPNYALAHANLGEAYDKADRPQDALNTLDQALKLNPNLQ